MKKKTLLFVVLGVIILGVAVYAAVSYFSVDRTARAVGEKGFIIQGESYVSIPVGFTKEGKTVAKADNFDIMEIPEDESHTFLAVRSFLDNWIIVKESYVIPTSGKLNVAYVNHERIADGEKLKMAQSILDNNFQGAYDIKFSDIRDIYNATMDIYVGYGDCPVGTDRIGVIGNINGQLVFIKADDIKNDDLQCTCYVLNKEYQELYSDSVHRSFDSVENIA